MTKIILNFVMFVLITSLLIIAPEAFAKKDGSPGGWEKGEKKGWHGGELPPGLSKKEEKQAKKEAAKTQKEAARQAKKADREAKKLVQKSKR